MLQVNSKKIEIVKYEYNGLYNEASMPTQL